MYSWQNIRTVCALLLLVPVIHLAYLVSRETRSALDPSPEVWAEEVAAYTRIDQASQLPRDPIVVLGGRRVKLWQGLPDLLAPLPVLMRGIGEATMDDIAHYQSRLVSFYDPQAVVLLPGSSEFHIRDNKSAAELLAAIRNLRQLDMSYGVTRQYYVITPVKTPLHPGDYAKIDELNRLLRDWAQTQDKVTILNPNAYLSGSNRAPNPDFYRIDGVNLNEQGYLRLSILVRNQIEQDNPTLYPRDSAR